MSAKKDPVKPSKEQVEMHWLQGHVVFRNWCPICVKSKAKDDPHRSDDGRERKVPEYSFDYCFPGDEF